MHGMRQEDRPRPACLRRTDGPRPPHARQRRGMLVLAGFRRPAAARSAAGSCSGGKGGDRGPIGVSVKLRPTDCDNAPGATTRSGGSTWLGKPGIGSSAERRSCTDGLIGMCVARPSAWADAWSDARRLPLAAPELLVARALRPPPPPAATVAQGDAGRAPRGRTRRRRGQGPNSC